MDYSKHLNPKYNWIDITNEFVNSSKELKLGELVHDDLFSLYDGMAAIELMDPKMDAGMMCNKHKKILTFEERIDKNLIKINDFTFEELIGIIDDTYSCLVAWLDGHSLAQTVFINLYLHNPNLICDKNLRSFSIAILKIVDIINKFVIQAQVYEEEDFQPKTYGNLANDISNSKALVMIKVVEEELSKKIYDFENSIDEVQQNNLVMLKALLVRFNFTKNFYLCLYNFQKQVSNNQNALPLDEFLNNLKTYLSQCDDLMEKWLLSIDYGVKPLDQTNITVDHNKPDYPTIIGFEPLINQRLLPPSFPRYTKIKPREDTVNYLKCFIQRIKKLLKIYEIDYFVDVVKFFNDFSKTADSCVVSRSMLQLFYMPQSNLIFGETQFIKIIKDSCKQFITPSILNGKVNLDQNTKEIIEAFFNRCFMPFKSLIQTYGHNRARQREKIAVVLKDFISIMDESITLDRYLTSRLNNSFFGYFQFWVLFNKLSLMSQYLLSGFELELYARYEYSYIFMELEYIWDYIVLILKRATEVFLQQEAHLKTSNMNNNSNKNRKKQIKNKNKDKMAIHDQAIVYYKASSQMAGALHRITLAFCIENKISQPKQNLNTERIRYNHRYLPLTSLKAGLLSYDKYKERFDLFKDGKETNQLYAEASYLLAQARNQFETIKDNSLIDEVQSYIKIAKTNTVVINLLLSGHNTQITPDFIFSESTYFPIIKFSRN